jgi:hypothetical protein
MRDHLYRLAAHALDRLPAAAPRVGSRFEPVPDDEPPLAEMAPATAGPVAGGPALRQPLSPATAPSCPSLLEPEDGPVAATPTDPRRTPDAMSSAGDPADSDPSGAPPRPSDVAPSRRDSHDSARPATVIGDVTGAAAAAVLQSGSPVSSRMPDDKEAAPPETARPRRRTAAAAPTPAVRADESAHAPAPRLAFAGAARRYTSEDVAVVRVAPVVGGDSNALLPPDVPEPRSSEGGLPPPAPAAPEPTIHVSIGRVEVRATPPPATAPPAVKAPAVMGLDDYQYSATMSGSPILTRTCGRPPEWQGFPNFKAHQDLSFIVAL